MALAGRRAQDLRPARARAARRAPAGGRDQRGARGAQRRALRRAAAPRDRAAHPDHLRSGGGAAHLPRHPPRARARRRPAPAGRRRRRQRRAVARAGRPPALDAQPAARRRAPDAAVPHQGSAVGRAGARARASPRARARTTCSSRVRRAGAVQAIGTSGTVHTLVAMALAARGDDAPRLHGASAARRPDRAAAPARAGARRRGARRAAGHGRQARRPDARRGHPARHHPVARRRPRPRRCARGRCARASCSTSRGRAERAGPGVAGRAAPQRAGARARATRATNAHGRHVARCSRSSSSTRSRRDLGLPPAARELLEYAALLHDIGHAIEHDRHQRHTYYLIRASELLGFSPVEIETIALVARGHRKQAPRLSDPDVQTLPPANRRLVRGLAALLRVADALDRTHFGVIERAARVPAARPARDHGRDRGRERGARAVGSGTPGRLVVALAGSPGGAAGARGAPQAVGTRARRALTAPTADTAAGCRRR